MSTDITTRVVRTVDNQTVGDQPGKIAVHKVVMHLAGHGSESKEDVREALDKAVEQGRLERDEERVWIPEEDND